MAKCKLHGTSYFFDFLLELPPSWEDPGLFFPLCPSFGDNFGGFCAGTGPAPFLPPSPAFFFSLTLSSSLLSFSFAFSSSSFSFALSFSFFSCYFFAFFSFALSAFFFSCRREPEAKKSKLPTLSNGRSSYVKHSWPEDLKALVINIASGSEEIC